MKPRPDLRGLRPPQAGIKGTHPSAWIETKTRSEGIETELFLLELINIIIIETKTRSEGIETNVVWFNCFLSSLANIETKTRSEGIETI